MEFVWCGDTSVNSLNRGTVYCLNSLTFIRISLVIRPWLLIFGVTTPVMSMSLPALCSPYYVTRTVHDGFHIVPHGWCRVGCHGSVLYYLYPTYPSLSHCNCVWTYGLSLIVVNIPEGFWYQNWGGCMFIRNHRFWKQNYRFSGRFRVVCVL
jgi:hypothetical protein